MDERRAITTALERFCPQLRSLAQAAMATAILVIVLAMINVSASHAPYRWDWTRDRTHTLSRTATSVLERLDSRTDVWVVLSADDPLFESLERTLDAAASIAPELVVHYVDPVRSAEELDVLRKRFSVEAGAVVDGRAAAAAVVFIAQGDRHALLVPDDLIAPMSESATGVARTDERGLVRALARLAEPNLGVVCRAVGNGELPEKGDSRADIAELGSLLAREDVEVRTVDVTTRASTPFDGCDVVLVLRSRSPWTRRQARALGAYLDVGGRVLVAPPESGLDASRAPMLGVLRRFGITVEGYLAPDPDPDRRLASSGSGRWIADVRIHPATIAAMDAMERAEERLVVGRPVAVRAGGEGALTAPIALAVLPRVASVRDVDAGDGAPLDDLAWPVALAAEIPARGEIQRPARAVVIADWTLLGSEALRAPAGQRGGKALVLGAIGWLLERESIVEIEARPVSLVQPALTTESVAEIRRYVLFVIPGIWIALGLVVAHRRRR